MTSPPRAEHPAELPLVLRREPFGGLLFEPSTATCVEVDGEAYSTLRRCVDDGWQSVTDAERALMDRLRASIPSLGREVVSFHLPSERASRIPRYAHVRVLDAPTVVDLQITRRCRSGCPHCYMSSSPEGDDMPYDRVREVLHAAGDLGVCQLAIGGGEPLLHPDFVRILYDARSFGVLPNLTTTGDGMTPESLRAMAECCGAVALSLEGLRDDFDRRRRTGFALFEWTHRALRDAGVATVLQVTLSVENLPALPAIVDYCVSCDGLYGVLFLAYKSMGRGAGYQTPLSRVPAAELFPLLRDAFLRISERCRVGYDCCLAPGVVGMDAAFGIDDPEMVEGCTAMRTSVGITTDLDVVPCTFLSDHPLGTLREQSLWDVWHGERAAAFRERLDGQVEQRAECRACPSRDSCLGGCPRWDLVRCRARL
jgi:radical SAM protein with 4Fe4S-binding SPASM domain